MENVLLYTLKVWLTTVIVAPFLFLIVTIFTGARQSQRFDTKITDIWDYLGFTADELIFSSITWMFFSWTVLSAVPLFSKSVPRDLFICVAGVLLTISTFFAFFSPTDLIDENGYFGSLMLVNCVCVGCGCWYYRRNLTKGLKFK